MASQKILSIIYRSLHPRARLNDYLEDRLGAVWQISSLYRQSLKLFALRLVVLALLLGILYAQHDYVAKLVLTIIDFFKLKEIFKFSLPDAISLRIYAGRLAAILGAAYFLLFFFRNLPGALSVLVLDNRSSRLFYLHNRVFIKELIAISGKDISMVRVEESFPYKIFGVGTIRILLKNGREIEVQSIQEVREAFRSLSSYV